MAEAGVAMMKSKVAASVQKSFLDLQRAEKIRDLTRRLAAGYKEAALENPSAQAAEEAEMFQAELDYRDAYSQLKRLADGRQKASVSCRGPGMTVSLLSLPVKRNGT